MEKKISILNNRFVIQVSGPDNVEFLNNILTSNVSKLSPKEIFPSALLTPQGKILFDIITFVSKENNQIIYLECGKEQKEELIKKLRLYSLRQNVKIIESDLITLVTNDLENFKYIKRDKRFYKTNIGRIYLKKEEFDKKAMNHFTDDIFWYQHEKIKNCVLEGENEIPHIPVFDFSKQFWAR